MYERIFVIKYENQIIEERETTERKSRIETIYQD